MSETLKLTDNLLRNVVETVPRGATSPGRAVNPKTDICVQYKKGYRYILAQDFHVATWIIGFDIFGSHIRLQPDGLMILSAGYATDGVTGGRDSKKRARGWWTHDALLQMIAEGSLPRQYKSVADDLLVNLWWADMQTGARWIDWYYRATCIIARWAVSWGGQARPSGQHQVIVAP